MLHSVLVSVPKREACYPITFRSTVSGDKCIFGLAVNIPNGTRHFLRLAHGPCKAVCDNVILLSTKWSWPRYKIEEYLLPTIKALQITFYTMRYRIGPEQQCAVHTPPPEPVAPTQPAQPLATNVAWTLLVLAYGRFTSTDDGSDEVGAGLYYVGRFFVNLLTTETDQNVRIHIQALCSYVRRIAKKRLGEAVVSRLESFIRLSVDNSEDALTKLNEWLRERNEEEMVIMEVPSDADQRSGLVDEIGEYAWEARHGRSFKSGGVPQINNVYSGNGLEINNNGQVWIQNFWN